MSDETVYACASTTIGFEKDADQTRVVGSEYFWQPCARLKEKQKAILAVVESIRQELKDQRFFPTLASVPLELEVSSYLAYLQFL